MPDSNKDFNNIKVHTQYSICEGAIKVDELADYCKANKIKSLGLADSYNLCGALEFSEKLSKVGTQPIIGTQINLKAKEIIGKITLYATTETGYKNLTKLSSKSYLDSSLIDEPACDIDDLIQNNKDLILLTGNYLNFFGKLYNKNKSKDFEEILSSLKKNFNDHRLYIEIQRHNEDQEKNFENYLLEISKKLNLPLIASQEVFYLNQDMHEAHDALVCIGEKNFVDDRNRFKYSNQHFFKSTKDLKTLYSDIPEALENNYNFHLRFNFKLKKSKPILPSIEGSANNSPENELSRLAKIGLENRLRNFILKKENIQKEEQVIKKYEDRLSHEINIINSMDYASYFLIVSDYIKWAKKNSIPVGPGRGSGAGSLVAYCLDITDLDPIEFDLIFERFLNPDRISMPDFDIDFCEEKRDQVFEYLKTKYKNGVAHIITFGKLKARMALRDVGRVLGLSYGHVDRICKMVPFDPSRPLTLQESIDREPRFKEEIKTNVKVKKLLDLSLKLEGLNRNMATHAAGVVIAGNKLAEQFPLYIDHSSNLTLPSTQYDMYSSENAGLVKFDLLGLKTLTVIDKTIKRLKQKNINLNISKINHNDEKVFSLLSTGETTGLFQLESAGMRDAIRQMKPNKFDDIIALVALYRPGPMSNIPIYNDCKNGVKEPDYIHPILEEILKSTYGIIIYQEQVMQIAQTLAGFTAGEADILRRAMGKKKKAELDRQKERFISGAIKNGIKKDVANFVFTKIEPFAQYGFNKSHAAAYALIAYQTAYLKTYYKEDFIAATMSTELTNTSKLREFVEELKKLNIKIVNPSINESFPDFKAVVGKIFYGLGAIKNVGYEAISNIVNEREKNGKFKSLTDFISRVSSKDINKLQLEGLVKAGVFDEFEKDRNKIMVSIPKIIQIIKIINDEKESHQTNLFNDEENKEKKFDFEPSIAWKNKEVLAEEFKSIGFFLTDHPLNEYDDVLNQLNIKAYNEFYNDNTKEGLVAGTIMSIQEKKSAKGTPYAIVKFSDKNSEFELFLFAEILVSNREILKESETFVLTLQKDYGNTNDIKKRINVRKIINLDDLINKPYTKVTIELKKNCNIDEVKNLLSAKGETTINLVINNESKKALYCLDTNRKFELKHLKALKGKNYVEKIIV
ncbi:MAG: DNA polymerase III subunit alpha [Pelagibacteraceae bacterium]|nr:DNA polymerase III subunit alpha [Pelagibacteraceae bacterium]|tara:strand:+ start:1786 stop:5205 length:3420 start_codon:yes stop_codon:yes gene_type:complete